MSKLTVHKEAFETNTEIDIFKIQKLAKQSNHDADEVVVPIGILKRLVLDKMNIEEFTALLKVEIMGLKKELTLKNIQRKY